MQLRKADPRPVKELLQGSIFEIEKLSFLYEGETFTLKQFYPEVDLTGVRHGVVMTQSYDLVAGRKIKVPYITIGFLEPLTGIFNARRIGLVSFCLGLSPRTKGSRSTP